MKTLLSVIFILAIMVSLGFAVNYYAGQTIKCDKCGKRMIAVYVTTKVTAAWAHDVYEWRCLCGNKKKFEEKQLSKEELFEAEWIRANKLYEEEMKFIAEKEKLIIISK